MKTYNFKKGKTWQESDYPPYDFAWSPKPRNRFLAWVRAVNLPRWAEWVLFLASYVFCAWVIVQAFKTIWPGLF